MFYKMAELLISPSLNVIRDDPFSSVLANTAWMKHPSVDPVCRSLIKYCNRPCEPVTSQIELQDTPASNPSYFPKIISSFKCLLTTMLYRYQTFPRPQIPPPTSASLPVCPSVPLPLCPSASLPLCYSAFLPLSTLPL